MHVASVAFEKYNNELEQMSVKKSRLFVIRNIEIYVEWQIGFGYSGIGKKNPLFANK